MNRDVELLIIGGGAAGMAAAVSAYDAGVRDLLILERSDALGGVLHQCIHNGFGLHRFGEDLTGVEFAARYERMVSERQIPYLLQAFVIELREDRTVLCVHPKEGLIEIRAKAIILAMGCRERSRNALLIPGTRGAGILTAGTAQRYLNLNGWLPGHSIVIVGSGDIGLIMARQFVLEGLEVKGVVEIMPYSGGLPRNMKQCIEDFDIPVYYSSSITKISGRERVSSVTVSKVDAERRPVPGSEFTIDCDTVLISAGLIPENELSEEAGIALDPGTKGAVVTEDYQTSIPGIFACGNVLHVHDLVDFVSEEAERTGRSAAAFLSGQSDVSDCCPPKASDDRIRVQGDPSVRGVVPQVIRRVGTVDAESPGTREIHLQFRPAAKYGRAVVEVLADEVPVAARKAMALTPGEMCDIPLTKEQLSSVSTIRVRIREVEA